MRLARIPFLIAAAPTARISAETLALAARAQDAQAIPTTFSLPAFGPYRQVLPGASPTKDGSSDAAADRSRAR